MRLTIDVAAAAVAVAVAAPVGVAAVAANADAAVAGAVDVTPAVVVTSADAADAVADALADALADAVTDLVADLVADADADAVADADADPDSDADAFADSHGVPEAEILSTEAHDTWRTWLENRQEKPSDREGALRVRPLDGGPGTGKLFGHDTIGVLAIDEAGVLAAGCSTSGLAFKVPGRVGDSPIVGHGLYVLPGIGAVTATGTGELISGTCVSFVAIEAMRNGATPFEAVASSLDRVDNLEGLESYHQVALVAMDSKGTVASGALRGGFRAAIHDEQGGRVVDPDVVVRPDDQPLPEKARDGISQGEDT